MIVIIFIVYVGTLFYGVFAQANETVPHTKSNCVITQEIDPDTMIVLREKWYAEMVILAQVIGKYLHNFITIMLMYLVTVGGSIEKTMLITHL